MYNDFFVPSRDYSSFSYQPSDLLTYILFCHSIKSVQKTYHINWAWNINRFIYRSAIKTKELKAIFDNILIFLSDVRKVLLDVRHNLVQTDKVQRKLLKREKIFTFYFSQKIYICLLLKVLLKIDKNSESLFLSVRKKVE